MDNDILSLRNHLMNWLFTPLFVLWIFSTAAGYMATLNYANQPYDLALKERALSLAGQMNLGGQTHPDGAPAAETGDRTFYTITTAEGRVIAGNAALPHRPVFQANRNEPVFSDGEFKGQKIRMVSLRYQTNPADTNSYALLQMAETIDKRQALTRGILGNIVIPQLLLIIMAGGAVWYALKRGLQPLEHLRQEVAQRSRDDLSLLDEKKAPVEVQPLIEAVNDLLQRLKQVMESQKRFIADAAHQLRTPFAGLKTQAELALREADPALVRHALHQILASAERCSHLVNQLLSLARNEPGGHTYSSFAMLNLNRVAKETTMLWVPEALKKNIDLGFEGSRQVLPVRGDAIGLQEMIGNLLDNAIRYTPPGGTVTLRAGYEEGGAVLRVEDNGPGISEEHRGQVFERFYRILGSGQVGSGLGLAIVREVVNLHEARISLGAGTDGKGTLVTVNFPHHSAV
ncbi:sensor histidine kinase [Sulfuricella sp.]|uniref:sensor histidine kinase n=1 Tax=Sulfuricella sp. TaxID=2099377 RepID=UPI002CF908FE|nr:sensor histidine kinase N-terminal domain-containing protein [Sulfuricella sp.]HUX62389.1 sensor histidine kinase N-terminal domain-containing protein [Sulfuricella sp.]